MAAMRTIRHSDRPRGKALRALYGIFRFVLYGIIGLAAEVSFYSLTRIGRHIPVVELLFRFGWHVDPALHLDGPWHTPLKVLYGQSSLWMFPVYGVPCFFLVERIYRLTFKRSIVLRALLYGLAILAFEAVSGLALKAVTGYAIWYYDDRLAIAGMTSLYIWPIWCLTGLLVELIYRELMDPRVRAALEAELAEPAPRAVPGT
jgi:hypothetical protein